MGQVRGRKNRRVRNPDTGCGRGGRSGGARLIAGDVRLIVEKKKKGKAARAAAKEKGELGRREGAAKGHVFCFWWRWWGGLVQA